jgi:hypothetical protein
LGHALIKRGRKACGEIGESIGAAHFVTQRVTECANRRDELARVLAFGSTGQRQRLPCQRAAVNQQRAPQLAAFPPAFVTRAVAKAEKHGQRDADQRERRSAESDRIVAHMVMHEDGGNRQREDQGEARQ